MVWGMDHSGSSHCSGTGKMMTLWIIYFPVCLLTSLPVIEESYWLFCIFILQLGNLLSSLISCNSFSVMLSEFSRSTIAASINKNTFSSFIPIVIPHKGFLLCYIGYNVGLITNSLKWWNLVVFWRLYKNLKSFSGIV